MSKTNLSAASAAAMLLAVVTLAVETKTWVQDHPTDFEKGSMKKLAMRSDGRLRLAPEVTEVLDASQPYLWALVEDSKGNLYTSSGGPGTDKAKIFQIDAKGKSKTVAEVPGAAIHALALNAKDELFAATSPDGKVYKVVGNRVEPYYDPKAKYIWALAFDASGALFVATGDQGDIHRVTAPNQGKVFFKLDEAHARSMVIDRQGNVIVGTEPGGLVLRVTPAGEGFVLYQSTRREITALTLSKTDELYVAGVGSKQGSPSIAPPPPVVTAAPPPPGSMVNQAQPTQRIAVVPPTFAPPNVVVPGGSEVYKLDRDGAPLKIWSHASDVVYAIALDAQGTPWIGTGNKGGVHRIDTPYLSTLLASLQPTQVTAMAASRQGGIYAVTGNVGKLFRLGPVLEKEGTIESEVLDVGTFTQWGRLHFEGQGAGIAFETRSGNLERPQKNWSAWAPLKDGRVTSPAARFLQWRGTLRGDGKQSPELKSIDVAYRAKNLPPRIEDIQATPQNYKPPATGPGILATTTTLNLPPLGRNRQRPPQMTQALDPGAQPMTVTYSKGTIGARWLAVDDNGDTLEYKLDIKGVSETTWKPLKDKTRDRAHSWDATAFPDGQYVLRVTATDQPDNAPGTGLSASMESEPFTIDNTAPAISGLAAETAGTNLNLRFRVRDGLSMLQAVEYSINGGEWQWAEPTTRLTDSTEHEYQLVVERPGAGEVTVAVRASDVNDNQAVEKTVVK